MARRDDAADRGGRGRRTPEPTAPTVDTDPPTGPSVEVDAPDLELPASDVPMTDEEGA
ncbi:MAG: hypothetical protein R3F05_05130 [Planctomycetota bacterium]